jgi:thymidylate synthase (FAD)
MPHSEEIPFVGLPMKLRFGEKPKTKFVDAVESVKVYALDRPNYDIIYKLYGFMNATWADNPSFECTKEQAENQFELLLQGKALPTAFECIQYLFIIKGITLQEVSHLLRHRMASFSAQCSGDLWWTNHDAIIPESIAKSKFKDKYEELTRECKKLYCDMIDSKEVSIMNARYILNRNLTTFYYMRMNLGDILNFIKQRKCTQIQPATDNRIAEMMYNIICEDFPQIKKYVSFKCDSSCHYVKTANSGKSTNLYLPDESHDIFNYNKNNFIYQKTRKEMNESYNPQK